MPPPNTLRQRRARVMRFAGLELNEDAIPNEAMILKFRRWLEQHGANSRLKSEILGRQEGRRENVTF